ncbi:hypothetical protein B0J11DRAFT_448927 [Dendryphion nanum]|uniref:Transcription initiation factor TFIID subunit 4 n=1 Tax=Dendryphion nanum TaxID=256645 RepID=A0A9P9I7M9_9PLEO|nr:hypothetical protein B0J11DRAFT_448927 [Dendryphion nanum]
MASPPYQNPYGHPPQHGQSNIPPLQTQNLHHQQQQPQRAFSPQSQYHQSPQAMSPNYPHHQQQPPAKRPRLSPDPRSPAYGSPYNPSPYGGHASPNGAASPSGGNYLSLPGSPAAYSPPPFHQPQPYSQAPPSSMPPPKVPASKTQDNAELEKANPRDMDVNNISDVLTGSGIDLRAEEDNLLHTFSSQRYGNSFNSQVSGSTISPHGSFNNWQGAGGAGAFQGTGPLSQPMTKEQQEEELVQKHAVAARAYSEIASAPLADPFLHATLIRHRVTARAYEFGLKLNLEGLFDKIPDTPQNVTRTAINGSDGESISALQADSLLNQNAPFVEILSLISLATEERIRTLMDDSYALSQGRQQTSHGVVTPNLADIAVANGEMRPATAIVTNISKTAWEAPDSAISPMTVTMNKQLNNAARLPTPPTDASPTPQPTVAAPNHVADALKSIVARDFKYEEARLARRKQRQQGEAATPIEPVPVALTPTATAMTKKEQNRLAKAGQTDEVLHRKANETASMALGFGKRKKYSWMTGGGGAGGGGGGGGGGSGTSTPRLNTGVGGVSGASTPAQAPIDRALQGAKRTFGAAFEAGELGRRIQVRDVIHVMGLDCKERKTLASTLAKLKNSDRDEGENKKSTAASAGRV